MLKENAGAPIGCIEALLQSPIPPMINADDMSANANFGISISYYEKKSTIISLLLTTSSTLFIPSLNSLALGRPFE